LNRLPSTRSAVRHVWPHGCEIETHEGVAPLENARHTGLVCLAAPSLAARCEFAASELGDTLDRQIFGDVDELAPAIIPTAWIAFGIFFVMIEPELQHGAGDDVFGRDQLDLVALTAKFGFHGFSDFRVAIGKRSREKGIRQARGAVGGKSFMGEPLQS